MNNDFERLVICFLAIYVFFFFFGEVFKFFVNFLKIELCYLLLFCRSSLYSLTTDRLVCT